MLVVLGVVFVVRQRNKTKVPNALEQITPLPSQSSQRTVKPTVRNIASIKPSAGKPTQTPTASPPQVITWWQACQADADCVFVRNGNDQCPIGANKAQAAKFDYSCSSYAEFPQCPNIEGPTCYWAQLGCVGAPNVKCTQNKCVARPCGQ